MPTKIEWADITINPVVGCSHCSPGCDHCYAERFAARLAKNPKTAAKYRGVVDGSGKWTGVIDFSLCSLDRLPLKPKRIFIGSMCDMFHDSVMDYHLEQILNYITVNPQHTFMFLTKRPERMHSFFANLSPAYSHGFKNIWIGVTVCNQAEADAKIPLLLQTPATKRFVSVEPCLGPVDLKHYLDMEEQRYRGDDTSGFLNYKPLLHWVICGGETGPGARPMHPDWVRSLRDQCQSAGRPFFFKGWGEWHGALEKTITEAKNCNTAWPDGTIGDGKSSERGGKGTNLYCVGKRRAGRLLDGREWNEAPEER